MSRRWRYGVTFVGGLVIGAVATAALVGWHWKRNFANWYVVQLADQANVAKEVLSGRGPDLAERIKTNLPAYVHVLRSDFADSEGAEWALWLVSDVYRVAGTPPPSDLQTVFASLPPRPSCERPAASRVDGGAPR